MNQLHLVLLVFCTWSYVQAAPNQCCSDGNPMVNRTCSNANSTWMRLNCEHGTYVVYADEYQIQENLDEMLHFENTNILVERGRYCLVDIETENETVAYVCFPEEPSEPQSFIFICCIASIIFLFITVIVYCILPDLRDLQGKCMMCTLLSLMLAFTFLAMLQGNNDYVPELCIALATLTYFWFTCVFFWLNVVAFNVWRSVVQPKLLSNKRYLLAFYSLYGWGGPLLMLIILLICHHTPGEHIKPGFGNSSCWFDADDGRWAYFVGPITVLITLNVIMFISTAWSLWKQQKNISEQKTRSRKFKFLLYLKLFIVMGICWIFEPLSDFFRSGNGPNFWIVTDFINALQGVFIFLLLIVFRKRVRRDLARKGLLCHKLPNEWATMPDEQCDELQEEVEELTSTHDNNATENI